MFKRCEMLLTVTVNQARKFTDDYLINIPMLHMSGFLICRIDLNRQKNRYGFPVQRLLPGAALSRPTWPSAARRVMGILFVTHGSPQTPMRFAVISKLS